MDCIWNIGFEILLLLNYRIWCLLVSKSNIFLFGRWALRVEQEKRKTLILFLIIFYFSICSLEILVFIFLYVVWNGKRVLNMERQCLIVIFKFLDFDIVLFLVSLFNVPFIFIQYFQLLKCCLFLRGLWCFWLWESRCAWFFIPVSYFVLPIRIFYMR